MKENVGWLYPKNSILKKIIDNVALEMTQTGIDKKIYDKYFASLSQTTCEPEPFVVIGYDICQATFLMLIGGSVIAFIILSLELEKALKSPSNNLDKRSRNVKVCR